jgi:hypothetical protein
MLPQASDTPMALSGRVMQPVILEPRENAHGVAP